MKSCCKDVMENNPANQNDKKGNSGVKWLKRIGLAGFLFFLVKGIIWIVVLYGGLQLFGC